MESDGVVSGRAAIFVGLFLLVFLYVSSSCTESGLAADTENCLLCHRYPLMGKFDKDGTKRVFYVNDTLFAGSAHGRLSCKDCHVGLDKIPHTDVKKVDCSSKCHMEEPSAKKEFSHGKVAKIHQQSAHGAKPSSFTPDLPTCKYCHKNRILNPPGEQWSKGEPLFNEATGRCLGCHTEQEWVERFYSHVSHRMRQRRSQADIVKLCMGCHVDREMMARHGLRTVEAFTDTYHWALIKYGVQNAPDCLSCHIPIGHSKHEILPGTDPSSPTYVANRINTCRHQGGVQVCHPNANADFVAGREHAVGMKGPVSIAAGENIIDRLVKTEALLLQRRPEASISDRDLFYDKILALVRLFYKILIANIIGFMALHQLLDYIRTKKNRSR